MENYGTNTLRGMDSGRSLKSRKKKRRRIILLILGIILAILIFFGADLFLRLRAALEKAHQPVDTIDLREEEAILGDDPISILILGIDRDGPHDQGRSDTMMLATINPNTNSTYLLSIARDTQMYIVGNGSVTRANHAYAYGGAQMSINTVQNFLNVPIDYYVELDMVAFGPLIDAVGGVTVYNDTLAFSAGGYDFPLGYVDLTGNSALAYVRMRMQDPHGDFGRQQRQRAVIGALSSDLAGIGTITRYRDLLDVAGGNMLTDLTLNDILGISTGYTAALRNITDLEMRGSGQMINGMSLIVVSDQERMEISNQLRRHLELD